MSPLKMRDIPPGDLDILTGWCRIALAWVVYAIGSISLSKLGVLAALIFTILQIIVLLRDKFGFFQKGVVDERD